MRNRASVLTESQRSELIVEDFIYHIIKTGEEQPEYLDEVVIANDSQRAFFRDIIAETGQGTQYVFIEQDTSPLADFCRIIISDPDTQFNAISRQIASFFLSYHTSGRTSDGVFIIARVTIPLGLERKSLISLIKLDYTPVLRQNRLNTGGVSTRVELEEILEALSENKASVQKRAIIDVENNFDWHMLAIERKKTGSVLDSEDAITDYFQNFLGAKLRENNSTLTKRVVKECHQWAKNYDGDLGGMTAGDIRHKVISVIETFDKSEMSYEDLKARICLHHDNVQAQRISISFDEHMGQVGLRGVSFNPMLSSIRAKDRKGHWETDSGIKIVWNGERNPAVLMKTQQNDGSFIITIKANDIQEIE
jgi:hypothetical protein